MPAIRKPIEILELNGSFKKDPNRRPKGTRPTTTTPLGHPPAYFTKEEVACWRELGVMFVQLLCQSDRWIVEAACLLMAKTRRREATSAETGRLMNCISLMGGTPADRSRVSVAPTEDTDPFAEFMQ
jgi:hypothetical protein